MKEKTLKETKEETFKDKVQAFIKIKDLGFRCGGFVRKSECGNR